MRTFDDIARENMEWSRAYTKLLKEKEALEKLNNMLLERLGNLEGRYTSSDINRINEAKAEGENKRMKQYRDDHEDIQRRLGRLRVA